MTGHGPAGAAAAGLPATLAFTGIDTIWLFIAAFTLIGAGLAIKRIVPNGTK